jgi:phosphatidylinositol dimannoside acyltransferase
MSGEPRSERIAYEAYRTIAWLGRILPTVTGRMLFRWAGSVAYHLMPGTRAVVAANQAQVLGRPVDDPLVVASTKQAFRLYARYWFDAFHVLALPTEQVVAAFDLEGLENLERPIAEGTGAIAVLPHMGNWDATGIPVGQNLPLVTVAERLRPERLYQLFVAHRAALGYEVIALSGDGDVGKRLRRALEDNKVVALLADRDLSGRGVEVEMFGAVRKLPAGPALLSIATGAPIVVCDLFQTPTGWRCVLHEPIDVPLTGDRRTDVTAITREIGEAFERAISAAPADWHMFQPAWEG